MTTKGLTNAEKTRLLSEQIDRRIELLNNWIDNGLPDGIVVHKLAHVRKLSLPEFDIKPIGSAGSFVTTHPKVGDRVKKIGTLLVTLNKPAAKSGGTGRSGKAVGRMQAAMSEGLKRAAKEYTLSKIRISSLEADLRVANESILNVEQQLDEERLNAKELQELRDLKKRLSDPRQGTGKSKVVRFPGPGRGK